MAQEEEGAGAALRAHLERIPPRLDLGVAPDQRLLQLAPPLHQPLQPRPLRRLEGRVHGVQEQRTSGAEQVGHQAAEGLAEAGVRPVPARHRAQPLAVEIARPGPGPGNDVADSPQHLLDRRSQRAHAERRQRLGVRSEIEGARPVGRQHGGLRRLGPVVVLGRHPEDRHGRFARLLQRRCPAGGRHHLGHAVERTAQQSRLLAGDHHARRRVRKALRQPVGVLVAVGAVGNGQGAGELAPVAGRRAGDGRQSPRRQEAQGRQQVEVAAGEPRRRERRQEPRRRQVEPDLRPA